MPTVDISQIMSTSLGGVTLADILSAIVTLVVCLAVIRVLMRTMKRLLAHTKLDEKMKTYLFTGIRTLLYLLTAIIVVGSLGVDMTSLVALLSIGSLGITLAAEDILGNVAGGLVILSSHPFAIGDFIEVDGTMGSVIEISLNHTKLQTPDGLLVMLPNKELASSKVINYTVLGRRRIVKTISAPYDVPTEKVKSACMEAVSATENILTEPAPVVFLTNYGKSAMEYTVYCWVETANFWVTSMNLGEAMRESFAANGVKMTYEHLNVHIVEKQ